MTGHHKNSLQPGYLLHWYEIESVLGQGGFGMTYLATDRNLNHQVAIKEYLPGDLVVREQNEALHPVNTEKAEAFAQGMQRFMLEARTLACFKHPNIVRVLTTFEANNTAYMVMEYERGRSLRQILKKCGSLTQQDMLRVMLPIMEGLARVHDGGFIHRDIKPDNIFIRSDHTPVLLDFGSARQSVLGKGSTLTAMVTPGYAPYEQYQSVSDQQGPWSDIYGLAATMYRAIAGVAPMDALERSNSLLRGGKDTLVSASEIGRDRYPQALLAAIDHGLAFREEDRPQTIAEWRHSMADLIASADTVELPTRTPVQLTRQYESDTTQAFTITEPHVTIVQTDHKALSVAELVTLPVSEMETLPVSEVTTLQVATEQAAQSARRSLLFAKPALAMYSLLVAVLVFFSVSEAGRERVLREIPLNIKQTISSNWDFPLIDKQGTIQQLLLGAEVDLSENRLTTPAGNNALEKYRKVFRLEEGNLQAGEGLTRIIERYGELAKSAMDEENFIRAGKYLDKADTVIPDTLETRQLRLEMDKQSRALAEKRSRQAAIDRLLAEAHLDMKAGRNEKPLGNNAREKYQQVLAMRPGDEEATAGMREINALHEARINASVTQKNNAALAENGKEGLGSLMQQLEKVAPTEENLRKAGNHIKRFFTELR